MTMVYINAMKWKMERRGGGRDDLIVGHANVQEDGNSRTRDRIGTGTAHVLIPQM